MGICQTYPHLVEPEVLLPPPKENIVKNPKPTKPKINQQVAMPVTQIPALQEQVKLRLEELGDLDENSFEKYESGKPMGPYKFSNGTVYHGEWYKNGKPHGKGKYYLPDDSLFEGVSVEGEIQGYGRIIHPNGDYFQGEFKHGHACGTGKYVENYSTYQGYFKDNLQHGIGYEYSPIYEFKGEFVQGQKKRGKLTYKTKKVQYDGEFKFNKFHGAGVLVTEHEKYEGEFVKGLKCGKGKLTQNDGSWCEGEWKNDLRHGKGRVFDRNGKLLKEERWENGAVVLGR